MTIYYIPPKSIEGGKAQAVTRKVITYKPQKNSKLNKLVFPFKLDMNSKITISEELNPKNAIIDELSILNYGDGLQGDMISGFSTSQFKQEVVNESGRHKASALSIRAFVYAKLEKAFASIERKYIRTLLT